ncbi:EAL and HDOD domain-containing protein [Gemmatimonas groenlandica]|uniref:EAL domain-containing protein n=1 Tax=Gemmatimonas groenlandica TaxID=2732249 RepID=A0A6M4ISP1_9BACT|nr:HDOD domain-containing protein [Gemmatimonas groenlandica]QJR36486.1 EAL domain-containing protein [Gemmatimonas groenlandica]
MSYTEVDVTPPPTAQHVFIARQPIFDTNRRRVAYELLYRAHRDATQAIGLSESHMCGDTALHALLSIGLDRLTAGTTAFVNITREHLLGELYKIFDPTAVVLELLETIDGDPAVVDACERAVAEGYRLALDDYDSRPSLDPLLPFASIVKLDVLGKTADELAPAVTRLKGLGLTVLAERVETAEMLHVCETLGCVLFQGYVFSRPETLDGRAVNVQHATVFNIMALLNEPDVTDSALEEAFRSHPSLSLSLLRIVNSASFGARSVDSISYAIRLIGREALSRWMLIMLIATVGAQSPVAHEAVVNALVRGRFCETVTAHGLSGDPSARFLVGLLSRMDALLGLPMESVLERLPVSADVRDALLLGTGPHAPVLRLADAYERGEWAEVDADDNVAIALRAELAGLYADAALWATERLRITG